MHAVIERFKEQLPLLFLVGLVIVAVVAGSVEAGEKSLISKNATSYEIKEDGEKAASVDFKNEYKISASKVFIQDCDMLRKKRRLARLVFMGLLREVKPQSLLA
jgi:hypothetical protein